MVVDRSQVERERHLKLAITKERAHKILNIIQAVHFLLIREEHVSVDFMNEDFILNAFVYCLTCFDDVSQLSAVHLVVLWLCVDHINERAAVLDCGDIGGRGLLQVIVAWEVLDRELNVGVVVDHLGLYLVCWGEEEGLVGRHLLEDHTLD